MTELEQATHFPKPDPNQLVGVYNPQLDDFTVSYDISGERQPVAFVAQGLSITRFPDGVAQHVAKHLANKILMERETVKNWDQEWMQVYQELLP